jgi:hypothetical protein
VKIVPDADEKQPVADPARPKTHQTRGEVSSNPAAPPRRGGLNNKSMDG